MTTLPSNATMQYKLYNRANIVYWSNCHIVRDDCKSGGGLRRHEKAEGCEKSSITARCVVDHGSESNHVLLVKCMSRCRGKNILSEVCMNYLANRLIFLYRLCFHGASRLIQWRYYLGDEPEVEGGKELVAGRLGILLSPSLQTQLSQLQTRRPRCIPNPA